MKILFALVFSALLAAPAWGWDFTRHSIPIEDIIAGGPPKDGIPALTSPHFIPADQADFLRGDDRVMGVSLNGISRAYPLRILSWHELVNDRFGDTAVLVSW